MEHTALDGYEMVAGVCITKCVRYGPHPKHLFICMHPSDPVQARGGDVGGDVDSNNATAMNRSSATASSKKGGHDSGGECGDGGALSDSVVLYLHGGGFVCSEAEMYYNSCTYLVRRGCSVFVADYPLAPQDRHPQPLLAVRSDLRGHWR